MAQITITGAATATLGGRTFSNSGTYVADVTDLSEQTRDIGNTYVPLGGVNNFAFIVLVNLGEDDILLRCAIGSSYVFFGVPPNGHLLLPGSGSTDGTDQGAFTLPAIRSVTSGGSRAYIAIGLVE